MDVDGRMEMRFELRMVVRTSKTNWIELLINNHPLVLVPNLFPASPATREENKNPPSEAAVLCKSTGAELAAARVRRIAFPV